MLESVAPAWGGGPIVGFFTFLECLIILLKNVMLVYEKYFFKACIDILQNFVGYFDINNKFFQVKINFHHLKVALLNTLPVVLESIEHSNSNAQIIYCRNARKYISKEE